MAVGSGGTVYQLAVETEWRWRDVCEPHAGDSITVLSVRSDGTVFGRTQVTAP